MADQQTSCGQRKPAWIRQRLTTGAAEKQVKQLVSRKGLHTVCEEAQCPNIHECWGQHKTATFMILGDTCTRHCRFCAVKTGLPKSVDWDEPRRVAESVAEMALKHVVITMVTRDDLADGGASVVAKTVEAIRSLAEDCTVEVLVSDMMAEPEAVKVIAGAKPEINSHNLETVRRLTPMIRSRSDYDRSLRYLQMVKEVDAGAITKSSLMLGLGETWDEILEAMDDLRAVDVDIMNLGQYLRPSMQHAAVEQYWTPDEFEALKGEAMARGFAYCESGPMVRSSYHAGAQYDAFLKKLKREKAAVS